MVTPKRLEDVGFVIQARLGSARVPRKMIRPFAGTTLLDIALSTVKHAVTIPCEQFYLAVHEPELVAVGESHEVQIFHRSERSAWAENLLDVYEWHDKLAFEYIVLINACAPLLPATTIDDFVRAYLASPSEGLFSVVEERDYFWDEFGRHLTPWPSGLKMMNTKFVALTYRAAHCLYAGRRDRIRDGIWMGTFQRPGDPALFPMRSIEAFDIDYPWQFEMCEAYYRQYRAGGSL